MIPQVVCLSFLVAIASAGIIGGTGLGGGLGGGIGIGIGGHGHVVDLHTPAKYEFKYGVVDAKTGDKKQQSEVRVGDVVKGEYSLAEPDGTVRVVKYTADDHNGFNAVVSRIGHAAHPQAVLIKKAVVPVHAHGIAVSGIGGGLGGLGGGLGLGGGTGLGGGIGGTGLGGGIGGIGIGGGLGLGGHGLIDRHGGIGGI